MDISQRAKVRFAAIAAAALLVGLGWWFFHRNGAGANAAALGPLAAPPDPLGTSTDLTTGTPTSGPVNPMPPLHLPTPGLGIQGPAFTSFTPASTPGAPSATAPTQTTVRNSIYTPTTSPAHPRAPAGHQQADALHALGTAQHLATVPLIGPALAVPSIYNADVDLFAGVQQNHPNFLPSLIQADQTAARMPIVGPIVGAFQFITGAGANAGANAGAKPAPAKKSPAAPIHPAGYGLPINSATAASQLAHRGGPVTHAAPRATTAVPMPAHVPAQQVRKALARTALV